jgi:hypothetical protein
MPYAKILALFILAAGLCCLAAPAIAEIQSMVLYRSDFSQDPGWTTNSPTRYYWDPDLQMYHFRTEGGTNGYACVPVGYGGDSFSLDYDVILLSVTNGGAFRLGITSDEMDITRGTNVLSIFEYGKYGQLMSLRVIDQNNHLHETSSFYDSYCKGQPGCDTRYFSENRTYHVTLRYNKELQNADARIIDKESGELVWGYYVDIGQDLFFLSRIAITTKGDYAFGSSAEGYIDNIELVVQRQVTPMPTPTPTETAPAPTTVVTTNPATTTPIPTKSPFPGILGCSSLVLASVMAWALRCQGRRP